MHVCVLITVSLGSIIDIACSQKSEVSPMKGLQDHLPTDLSDMPDFRNRSGLLFGLKET